MSQAERKRFFTISMASSAEVSSILEIAFAYWLINPRARSGDLLSRLCGVEGVAPCGFATGGGDASP